MSIKKIEWDQAPFRSKGKLCLIHVDIWQKTTKFCKAISLRFKKKEWRGTNLALEYTLSLTGFWRGFCIRYSTAEGGSPLWMECLWVLVVLLATVLQTKVLGIASLHTVCYWHLELQCCGKHFCTQSAKLGCGGSVLGALIHDVGTRLCHLDSILFLSSQSPVSFAHDTFQPGRIFAPQ